MDYMPLFARLDSQPCLVVGGGSVAARKARALHRAGGRVTLRAKNFGPEVHTMAEQGLVELNLGAFVAADADDFILIIAATSDKQVNAAVAAAAHQRRTLCNVVDDGDASTCIMPAIIDRSPVQIAISTGGQSPVLARRLKARLETLLPARLGALASLLGKFRDEARKRFPEIRTRRRFWQDLLDTDAAAAIADGAVRGAEAEQLVAKAMGKTTPASKAGKAFLVGAGPGNPDLLTVKAQRLLADADVVLFDRLVDPVILDRARRDAEFIDVGKAPGGTLTPQSRINELLITHVQAGARVVRLKGGDPFIFGRGGEELAALRAAGLSVEVVPGITAAQGCAAGIGLPLTLRGGAQGVTLVTAHGADGDVPKLDWDALCANGHTLVFYMGVARLADIRRNLLARLPPTTPVHIVEEGTTVREKVHHTVLAKLDRKIGDNTINAPAVVFVGTYNGPSAVQSNVA
jgi:uroporphyrin-III C-methyltransferase/precorrin-2 dehydrogenase/sirohydrochlorin ferrochelatase